MASAFIRQPRRLFLVDGIGAMLTASLLMGLLATHEAFFGMPAKVIYLLGSIAACFAVYSFGCYFFAGTRWRLLLRLIAFANLAYCLLTLVLLGVFSSSSTGWGVAYFIGESAVVAIIVYLELRTASSR